MLICCLLTGCAAIDDFRVNRQMDLGDKYLLEFEYDKAMLAYSKALQIEPKQVAAYKGLSDVFTAQKDIDGSINALKKGIAVAEGMSSAEKDADINRDIRGLSRKIVSQLTEMGDKAYDKANYDKAVKYYKDLVIYDPEEEDSYLKLSGAYEVMGDLEKALEVLQKAEITTTDLQEERDRLTIRYEVKKEYEELLGRLSDMINANDGQLAKEVLLTQDFLDLVAKLQEPLALQQSGDRYIVVYPNGFVYVGQMEDNMRSGSGSFYTNNSDRYVMYSGSWMNDKPNGSGKIDTVVYTNASTLSPNFYGEGYFTDGISEGQLNFSLYYQNGRRFDYIFNNTEGIPPAIRRQDGKNLIGYSINDSSYYFLMTDSSIFSVPDFEPSGYKSVFMKDITTN